MIDEFIDAIFYIAQGDGRLRLSPVDASAPGTK